MTDEHAGSTGEQNAPQTEVEDAVGNDPEEQSKPDPKGPIPEYLEEKEKRDQTDDNEPDPDHETAAEVGEGEAGTEPA